ncbi:MAG: hypothetical protein ACRDZ8_02855 [Acidimicrobiales bacterium]
MSRLKAESGAIFDALAHQRRVLIAKHGHIVAAIDPSKAVPSELIVDYATPGQPVLHELRATDINQSSPSAAVNAAVGGSPHYVTKDNQVYGLLREITDDELARSYPSDTAIVWQESEIEHYLASHPDANAEDLASLSDRLDEEVHTAAVSAHPDLDYALCREDVDQLRRHIEVTARDFAENAVALLPAGAAPGPAGLEPLRQAIEARTIAAVARLTHEMLSPVTCRVLTTRAVTDRVLDVAQASARDALDALGNGRGRVVRGIFPNDATEKRASRAAATPIEDLQPGTALDS